MPSEEDNARLRVFPPGKEIWEAISKMPRGKAPGMHGLTTEIIMHHWSTMRSDIETAIIHFFKIKRMLRALNLAILTLIPKTDSPERLEDYRPISCLGIVYKIFAKILASRLMVILPGLISTNRTAFIKGQRISEAVGLAQEFTQAYNCKSTSRRAFITIDFAKAAFDTLRWDAIEVVIKLMRINPSFR